MSKIELRDDVKKAAAPSKPESSSPSTSSSTAKHSAVLNQLEPAVRPTLSYLKAQQATATAILNQSVPVQQPVS